MKVGDGLAVTQDGTLSAAPMIVTITKDPEDPNKLVSDKSLFEILDYIATGKRDVYAYLEPSGTGYAHQWYRLAYWNTGNDYSRQVCFECEYTTSTYSDASNGAIEEKRCILFQVEYIPADNTFDYTVNATVEMPRIATAYQLGSIKVGDGLNVTSDGTLSASGGGSTDLMIVNFTDDGEGNVTTGDFSKTFDEIHDHIEQGGNVIFNKTNAPFEDAQLTILSYFGSTQISFVAFFLTATSITRITVGIRSDNSGFFTETTMS